MSYYNTTNLKNPELYGAVKKARTQDEIILDFFQTHRARFTPFQVKDFLNMNAPITSIRRSITSLTNDGYLEKTDQMRMGHYGKKCHCWTLSNNQLELF